MLGNKSRGTTGLVAMVKSNNKCSYHNILHDVSCDFCQIIFNAGVVETVVVNI